MKCIFLLSYLIKINVFFKFFFFNQDDKNFKYYNCFQNHISIGSFKKKQFFNIFFYKISNKNRSKLYKINVIKLNFSILL
jgi:hypothetical protein